MNCVIPSSQAAEALGRWEADRPNLLHFVAALTETRGIMRAEVARLQEVIAGARSARPTVSGGATTGFNVIQVIIQRNATSCHGVGTHGASRDHDLHAERFQAHSTAML